MRAIFKATDRFVWDVKRDLARPHRFAAERVGFISVRAAQAGDNLILVAEGYHPIADGDYLEDDTVGAMMGQEAIRKALNVALLEQVGMFHVHVHEHAGRPVFSRTDLREQVKFVPDFFKVRPQLPHGAIVLSHDWAIGRVWLSPERIAEISEFDFVGSRMLIEIIRQRGRVDLAHD